MSGKGELVEAELRVAQVVLANGMAFGSCFFSASIPVRVKVLREVPGGLLRGWGLPRMAAEMTPMRNVFPGAGAAPCAAAWPVRAAAATEPVSASMSRRVRWRAEERGSFMGGVDEGARGRAVKPPS